MGELRKTVTAVDLFCGAGGTSSGLALACKDLKAGIELIAINHWVIAVETHKANHPWATHYCESVERLNPRTIVPSGRLKLLVASPECTHHARARGARPMNEQSRATAWHILKWAQELYIENIAIENVEEFLEWGPLGADERPLKSKKGETFKAFVETLRSFDYRVEWRVLNAADFGEATSRKRLFILARRPSHKKIHWPEPSHVKDTSAGDLFRKKLKPWRAAREIIDWSMAGQSIFNRKRPLKKSTLERISAGLQKFCGAAAEPFLVILRRHMDGQSLSDPLPALCANGTHVGLCQPEAFVLQQQSGGVPRSVKKPLPTISGKGAQALVQPFIIPFYSEREGQAPRTHDVNKPLPAIPATGDGKFAIIDPTAFIITPGGPDLPKGSSVNDPLPTVVCKDRMGVVEPIIVNMKGQSKASSINKPLPTQCTKRHLYIAEPLIVSMEHEKKGQNGNGNGHNNGASFIVPTHHGKGDKRVYSTKKPMPTITSLDAWAIIEPYLVKYNGTGKANSVKEPLDTVTAKDRFGLVEPGVTRIGIDIRFRMLKPHELAAAMGFPKAYKFTGNREEQVKQVGNAVSVRTAKALCKALLED